MKTLKLTFLVFFLVGSTSVFSDCRKAYKDQLEQGVINATASYVTVVGIPVGIYNSYIAHQARKMKELIEEAKNKRVGKRTKGLYKSLNGIYTTAEIQKRVLKANKIGGVCKRIWNPERRAREMKVTTYRDYKNSLRLEIDMKLLKQGKPAIWNDPEDLR